LENDAGKKDAENEDLVYVADESLYLMHGSKANVKHFVSM